MNTFFRELSAGDEKRLGLCILYVQCGDAACAGAGNDNGWGYGEKRSDDAVEGGVGVRGWGGAVEEQGEGGRGVII